jgi:hypothetical protein
MFRGNLAGLAALSLLTIGIIGGLALATSPTYPPSDPCAQYPGDHQAYEECAEAASTHAVAESTEWLAGFTATLAFSTIVLAGASVWQGWLTHQSIELARKEFVATFRPKIVLRFAKLKMGEKETGEDEGKPQITLWFANTGGSKAIVNHVAAGWGTKVMSDSGRMTVGFKEPPGLPQALFPFIGQSYATGKPDNSVANGGSFIINVTKSLPIPDNTFQAIRAMSERLFVTGYVRYVDDNGTSRLTGFVRWYDPNFGSFQRVPAEWAHSDQEYED